MVAESAATTEDLRAALFLAAPIIVADYSDGTAALALDWYEELRDASEVTRPFTPAPIRLVTDDYVRSVIAATTKALLEVPQSELPEVKQATITLVRDSIPEMVADGFRDTITKNATADPAAAGWRRFARPGACKFCLMLAARGAVYTEATARFAAHGAVMAGNRRGGDCMCIAGPAFGGKEIWAEATPMQYLASRPQRDQYDRDNLRAYLKEHYPDAPG